MFGIMLRSSHRHVLAAIFAALAQPRKAALSLEAIFEKSADLWSLHEIGRSPAHSKAKR